MIVCLNGEFVQHVEAAISPFDRGFLFGDGVYEGLRASHGAIIAIDAHLERMHSGLREIRIKQFDPEILRALSFTLLQRNELSDAFIYWQITRGVPAFEPERRNRVIPDDGPPTLFGFAVPARPIESYNMPEIRSVALRPDTRWTRGHIKAISLLGGVLAAYEAQELGCDDAILHRDGLVTEGVATNVFLLVDGRLVTPSLQQVSLLSGITRQLLLNWDGEIDERPVRVEELHCADEVMLVGTNTMVASVSSIDGRPVGGRGRPMPGPASMRLLDRLKAAIESDVHCRHGS